MGLPKLNSCCCGCSLRTGTLILLYLGLISSLLTPFSPNKAKEAQDNPVPDQPIAAKIAEAIIGIVVCVAGLFGVYTERHGLLLPYLVLNAIGIVFCIIGGVILLFPLIIPGVIVLLFTLLLVYFFLVVYNHYLEIKEGRGGSSAA